MRIRLDKIDAFIKIHDKIRNLVLFNYYYFDEICDNTKYLISEKSCIQIVLIKVLQELELIHMILYLLKKY